MQFDVEVLYYKIKNGKPIPGFSAAIIELVDGMVDIGEETVPVIYSCIAQFFNYEIPSSKGKITRNVIQMI